MTDILLHIDHPGQPALRLKQAGSQSSGQGGRWTGRLAHHHGDPDKHLVARRLLDGMPTLVLTSH